jgi:hypothetical protein
MGLRRYGRSDDVWQFDSSLEEARSELDSWELGPRKQWRGCQILRNCCQTAQRTFSQRQRAARYVSRFRSFVVS